MACGMGYVVEPEHGGFLHARTRQIAIISDVSTSLSSPSSANNNKTIKINKNQLSLNIILP
ncbi:MAG: hypothetical protein ACI4QU_02925 [Christensenellales bacterium]